MTNKKRLRRSKAEMTALKAAIYELLAEGHPATDRQVFYRLVSAGVVGKTEAEYKGTIIRLLSQMRLQGEIPFSWIADNSRCMRKPDTYSSLESMLRYSAQAYRRSVWDNQNSYVEVWTEKDALAGVLLEVTREWDVPLMVSKGFASLSFLHAAAETIAAEGKPAYLFYFGDNDPSGLLIDRQIETRLRQFAPEAEIHFERVAVTPEQIASMSLPTRPTKTKGTHAKNFIGDSTEVDAIPPKTLRRIVSDCITQHIDQRAYDARRQAEAGEREALMAVAAQGLGDYLNELPF